MKEPLEIALKEINELYQRKLLLLSGYTKMVRDEAGVLQTGQWEPVGAILAAKDKKIQLIQVVDTSLEIYYSRLCALTGTATPAAALSAVQPGSAEAQASRAAIQSQLAEIQVMETANGTALRQLKAELATEIKQMREAQTAAANYSPPGSRERGTFFDRRE